MNIATPSFKGILLAGGLATRLFPATLSLNKHLLPVYDKPMIYYPLANLMLAGCREILLISSPRDIYSISMLLGGGKNLGIDISYKVQDKPNGIAQSILLAGDFLNGQPCCLALGDNIFHSSGFSGMLLDCSSTITKAFGAVIVCAWTHEPERYGVAEFDSNNRISSIIEKPNKPTSHWAVTGLYFYDGTAYEKASSLKPSARGELEITDLNILYLKDTSRYPQGELHAHKLPRGTAWLDTGTHEALLEASSYVQTFQKRSGLLIGSPEEVAFRMGLIDRSQLELQAAAIGGVYGRALHEIQDSPAYPVVPLPALYY